MPMICSQDTGEIARYLGTGDFQVSSIEQTKQPGHYLPTLRVTLPACFGHKSKTIPPLPFNRCVEILTTLKVSKENATKQLLTKCAQLVTTHLKGDLNQKGEKCSKKEALDAGHFFVDKLVVADNGHLVPVLVIHCQKGSWINDPSVSRHIKMTWPQVLSLYSPPSDGSPRKLTSPRTSRKKKNPDLVALGEKIAVKINRILNHTLKTPQRSVGNSFEYSE